MRKTTAKHSTRRTRANTDAKTIKTMTQIIAKQICEYARLTGQDPRALVAMAMRSS
jgi:hypothetical protein